MAGKKMVKVTCSALTLGITLVVLEANVTKAQEPFAVATTKKVAGDNLYGTITDNEVDKLTAQEFAAWVKTRIGQVSVEQQRLERQGQKLPAQRLEPLVLERALMRRFRSDRHVTDETVTEVVSAWTGYAYEKAEAHQKGAPAARFQDVMRVIEQVMPFIQDRPALRAYLHQRKATLFNNDEDWSNSAKEYQEALQLLTPLHVNIDKRRILSSVEMAEVLVRSGDSKRAEGLYLSALSYDWPKVSDGEAVQFFRDLYVRAGRGLIDIRRNNLTALKQIRFINSTLGNLGPYLQARIEEAERFEARRTTANSTDAKDKPKTAPATDASGNAGTQKE